jgi:hypothetical protein
VEERFRFYGYTVGVESATAGLIEQVRRDFLYFHIPAGDGRPNMRLRLVLEPPPYAELPSAPASIITPRNVCFRQDDLTYIDYFGKALAIFNRQAGECRVYGTDADLLHEIAYLFLLSTAGESLDARGLHRVHGLGVSYNGHGVLILLPSGGGKSTLALDLLRRPGFLLLGEDTPLIDRAGRMLPFPLRLGIRPDQKTEIPPRYLRTMPRMEFEPKTLIDLEYFQDRLGTAAEPKLMLVGQRNLGDVSGIVPLARHRALRSLVSNMVVGLGIYQGLEFLLVRGLFELVGKAGVASSRLYNALRLLRRAPAYRFVMGRNRERNTETLVRFVQERCG